MVTLIIAVLLWYIAEKEGHDGFIWFIIGLLGGPFLGPIFYLLYNNFNENGYKN